MIATGLALGVVLGWVMQRGRFCVTGMIRDVFLQKTWRGVTALFIVIAVHAIGLAALTSAGVITPEFKDFTPIAVILGGFIFGAGIVLAGGCASGTWFRSAEGLIGSWLALTMYALSSAAMKGGALSGLNEGLKSYSVDAQTIHGSLGISAWWLVVPFSILTFFLARHYLAEELAAPKIAALKPKKTGLAHLLAEKPWHFYSTAVIVGVLGVIAWPLSAATGRNTGLGITSPSADIAKFVVDGETSHINWGVLLVLGLFVGAFLAAKASGEFRLRLPSANQAVRSVVGGIGMGVGASLAGGCTVGNGMVQTSLFSYQGWVALLFISIGIWAAAKVWLKPTDPINAADISVIDHSAPKAGSPTATVAAAEAETTSAPTVATTTVADGVTPVNLGFQSVGVSGVALLERKTTAQPVGVGEKNIPGLQLVGDKTYRLDSLGAVCPFPLIDAKDAMKHLEVGESLLVDFDCTQATDAIPRWAAKDGHEVTNFEQTDDAGWTITVKKGQ